MPTQIISLIFNPYFWAAITFSFIVGLTGGIVKGINISNADYWQNQAAAFKTAAEDKDRIISADAARAATDQGEILQRDALIESLAHETPVATRCTLSGDELGKLRSLATANR